MSYVTLPLIGEIGNLGSQIQQYCSMLSIAEINNKKLVFPQVSLSRGFGFKFAELLDVPISIIDDSSLQHFSFVQVNNYVHVDNNVFNLSHDINYAFMSRFDLYHYWYHTIKSKVDNLQFQTNILNEAQNILSTIKNSKITISLHVRRGDYLLPQNAVYPILDFKYYSAALANYDLNNVQLIIFSNDVLWCQENLNTLHSNITYVDGNTDYLDLCLMSLCDHNIIANSSFSWWAAYLNKNPNKKIVCPKKYVIDQHEIAHIINHNYYPPNWISI
jgi:hypothetical protein